MNELKTKRLFSIKCKQPDLKTREKFSWMRDAVLPVAVKVKGYDHTTFKWNGTQLYVAMWNMAGDKFWTEAALGWLKPEMFTKAIWYEVPLTDLAIDHDAGFRYRD